MELKDVVLSTLAEMQEESTPKENEPLDKNNTVATPMPSQEALKPSEQRADRESSSDEKLFLESVRERMLVLFEGFQSPNNKQIEAKVDLTLNFLEYLLASIDERLDKIDAKRKQ